MAFVSKYAIGVAAVLAGIVFVAGSSLAARAEDPYAPSERDRQVVYDCLEAAQGMPELKIAALCVGVASDPCLDDPANQTTRGMAGCLQKEGTIWDELLNSWYGSVREGLSREPRRMLRDAQRAWIKWRDAKCAFEHGRYEGGTGGGPAMAGCLMTTTATRALELRTLVVEFEQR